MTSPSRGAPSVAHTVLAVLLALVVACGLGGCGGGGDSATQDGAAAARAYAAKVAGISTRTSARLAELSNSADYTKAAAAAASTRAYANAIRAASAELSKAAPPKPVAGLQRSLVALYAHTAGSLDTLATEFDRDRDPVALAASAQRLSSEIQRLASREQQLRGAIERALAEATTPQGR